MDRSRTKSVHVNKDADILTDIIQRLHLRVAAGAATFLLKVKSHRGEVMNEMTDIAAEGNIHQSFREASAQCGERWQSDAGNVDQRNPSRGPVAGRAKCSPAMATPGSQGMGTEKVKAEHPTMASTHSERERGFN
jgi:hypothetical protein